MSYMFMLFSRSIQHKYQERSHHRRNCWTGSAGYAHLCKWLLDIYLLSHILWNLCWKTTRGVYSQIIKAFRRLVTSYTVLSICRRSKTCIDIGSRIWLSPGPIFTSFTLTLHIHQSLIWILRARSRLRKIALIFLITSSII